MSVLRVAWIGCAVAALAVVSCRRGGIDVTVPIPEVQPGLAYTNYRVAKGPWSVHVVRFERARPEYTLVSTHAENGALGLTTLSQQVTNLNRHHGVAVAGVNGDFYERERSYAGDPRGLQIVAGELISAPIGGVSFWLDAAGQPNAGPVSSQFQVTWPNGRTVPFGLNEERRTNALVLFTPAVGKSTYSTNSRDLVLEYAGEGSWVPLQVGQSFSARIREIDPDGNAPVSSNTLVLSLPLKHNDFPSLEPGLILKFNTRTVPDLSGAATAISGGPMLVSKGKKQALKAPASEGPLPYAYRSMWERHPRSALGWNDRHVFLALVDGRQKELSVGMTLDELGAFLGQLGCRDVINLDGGGSATLWFDGRVRNSPCDRRERPIANALLLVKKNGAVPVPQPDTPSS